MMAALGLMPAGELMSNLRQVLQSILHDQRREGGVPQLITSLRYNAAAARDRLSDDTWRIFNRIERDTRQQRANPTVASMLGMLDTLVLDLAAFSGMQIENMTHGHGWRFLEIGRRIERAVIIAELVKAGTLAWKNDDVVLGPLLEICDSTMTYRRLHFARPQIVQTAYLLMQDIANPRCIAYQIDRLTSHVAKLPRDPERTEDEFTLQSRVEHSRTTLAQLDLPAMITTQDRAFAEVPETCTRIIAQLEELSLAITEHFFSHAVRRVR
jgi:uncharacterized alpha-E superfamily protein